MYLYSTFLDQKVTKGFTTKDKRETQYKTNKLNRDKINKGVVESTASPDLKCNRTKR